MSGAVAAHAAYNGSGTQGLAVTNKIHDDDGDVMSVFWNKNDTTRQLLYGSSIIEIPSSGASTIGFGGSRLFTVNNDIDCLGDMYLEIKGALPSYSEDNSLEEWIQTPKPFALQTFINRIEIQVGAQIWQTIENSDLRVVNSSEMTPDSFTETSFLTTPSSVNSSQNAWVVIPSLTKTLGPSFGKFTNQTEDGYPMAAAPHQSVKIKVHFRDEFPTELHTAVAVDASSTRVSITTQEDVPIQYTVTTTTALDAGDKIADASGGAGAISSCKLYAKQQIMCNEEREQMKAMPMGLPKRLKMTQNSYTSDLGSSAIKTIELDHFSLYASHLIISGNAGVDVKLSSVELKLNSSSFSGQLPGVLLDSCTSDSLGLYSNKYIYGSGSASGSYINVEEFGIGTYVFPLAATAFGGSCVPLNRFDSIRLTLTFTSAPVPGSSTFVNVTCVGETTALFKGGAASLAMY
jgi:hypothetical protein